MTACKERLDQSRDDRQDWVLREPIENLQESRIPKVKHRPECQTRQDNDNLMVPKASVW